MVMAGSGSGCEETSAACMVAAVGVVHLQEGVTHLHKCTEHVDGCMYDSIVLCLESMDHLLTNKLTHAGWGEGSRRGKEWGRESRNSSQWVDCAAAHLGSVVKAWKPALDATSRLSPWN